MVNITIKDLPEDVHAALKERAQESGRSLNRYLVHTLRQLTQPREFEQMRLHEEIRAFRESSPLRIRSIGEVQRAIDEGRA